MRADKPGAVPPKWTWPEEGPVARAADLLATERHGEGLNELRRLADAGDVDAAAYLGAQLDDIGDDPDDATALLEAAADKGHPEALFRLGAYEDHGREPEEQIPLLRRAAGLGHVKAAIELGQRSLRDGNDQAAVQWLRAAASLDTTGARDSIKAALARRPDLLEQFVDLEPPDPYAHGWEIFFTGDRDRAHRLWSAAYDNAPSTDAAFLLADGLERMDPAASASWWRRLRLHPGNHWHGQSWVELADRRLRRLAAADAAKAAAADAGLLISCLPQSEPDDLLMIFPGIRDNDEADSATWETDLERALTPVLAAYSEFRWFSKRARGLHARSRPMTHPDACHGG